MTLSIFESVIFYCIEKGRQLPYEVSPLGELFHLGKRLEGIVKKCGGTHTRAIICG